MTDLMPDNQTETNASPNRVSAGMDATGVRSLATKRNGREQDEGDITVGILSACDAKQPSDEDTDSPLPAEAELPGRNVLTLVLATASLTLLLSRLLYSILAASIPLLPPEIRQGVLALCLTGHAAILSIIGNLLRIRFNWSGDIGDLGESIRHQRAMVSLLPTGHLLLPWALKDLGNTLSARFERTGNIADLEESIRHHKKALTLRPIGYRIRASTLNSLGIELSRRFEQTGNMADLEESIRRHEDALTLRPIGHPGRASSLNSLGIRLSARYKRTGNMADLEKSIRHHEEALTVCPIGHPDRASFLANLGNSIRHFEEALTLRLIGRPDRALILTHLGSMLVTRFEWTGNMADLEKSIRHHEEALALRPIGHPDRALILSNLGNGLDTRFEWAGNIIDLEQSIRHQQEALTLCPNGHPERVSTLNNLGNGLSKRFERTDNTADLEESIRHHQEALTLYLIGDSARAGTLTNLGGGLARRFGRTGDMADLDESIRHQQEALTLYLIGDSARAGTLINLGSGLARRFDRTGNMADLEEGIRHLQEALTLHPIGHPDRAPTLGNLGNGLSIRFKRTGSTSDLGESIQHYTELACQPLFNVSHRLTGASNWIIAARHSGLESLEDAYSTYMDLLDRSLLLAASSIPDTHTHMVRIRRGMVGVTEDATSHAIKKHRLGEAIEVAERGRALLFTQLGNYRTPLNDLEVVNKGLADRFRALSTALDHSATSLLDTMVTLPTPGDQVARRQQIVADWDHTLTEIRQLDGFRDFLGVTPFATLQKAAADGPVILVNISRDGSYALIITATREPLSVPLPEATPDAVEILATALFECTRGDVNGPKSDQRLMKIQRDLWATIVAPIVLRLETTLGLPIGSRIWWMPTSWAWWLPLHAAGPYKSGQRNLSDRFLSSYATTLSSLIRSRSGYQSVNRVSGPRMLVVAQAEAEGQDQLPNVESEVAHICQLPTEVTVIEGEDCERDTVLTKLKDMAWVHFSCHGHQHPTKPFQSQFSLRTADAPLTLLDIIQNGLPQAELAFLSACHSASADSSSPNEAVNLAAGIMFAGFRSAVGTMWAMADEDGPVMAEHFYKYMFRNGPEGVDCRDAAKAMVMGVRELRRREVPLARWINFVHYGI
ncbi:hypothetical protein FRB95_004725 [Tulasnella sp. JGI-2019a]|nr:hypothetical protein FRB95_004725 [Tulasnella sp. JGI-2019a]